MKTVPTNIHFGRVFVLCSKTYWIWSLNLFWIGHCELAYLQCYLLLLIVGLAYALPAENPAKKKEPEAPAPIAPQSLEQENRNEAAAAQNPAAVAGDLVASAEKPKEGAATDEKKESLDSAETLWGWGGYGRGISSWECVKSW